MMDALGRADWPYNLRQLDGVVQRLLMEAAASGDEELALTHCVADLAYLRQPSEEAARMPTPEQVRERMRQCGSATATARSLGISRWTVYRYLERAVPLEAAEREDRPAADRA
jgi:transcriptional regulator of acetoin/glycerol metabolism